MGDAVGAIEKSFGYTFRDPELLRTALTHTSYAVEHQGEIDNERLEFLGDAVLQLAVTEYLYSTQRGLAEGEMSKVRHGVVSETALAPLAAGLGIGEALRLGKGEDASGGRSKASILSDGLEAILGAVYVDGGFEPVRRIIHRHWLDLIARKVESPGALDYKSRLQEILAARGEAPVYVVESDGLDHERTFTAEVMIAGESSGAGAGSSKKRAEQEAAKVALSTIE